MNAKHLSKKLIKSLEIKDIFEASQQVRQGFVYTGNLKEILKQRKTRTMRKMC